MSRLIDADKLHDVVFENMYDNPHRDSAIHSNHYYEHRNFLKLISEQPTVYDIDKVVEELERTYDKYNDIDNDDCLGKDNRCDISNCDLCFQSHITEIVKRGGIVGKIG
jgi:hypothetical protein